MKKYLITSALPYINGIKHLGNLVGSILPADVYARYLRQRKKQVLYICGTDDHGAPAEIAAYKASKSIDEYCKEMYQKQKDIYKKFNITFDYFGKTSNTSNIQLTQKMFKHLDENGYIVERKINQFYSIYDKRFLADRYITGTCPKCKYENARGDQCDSCGILLDPTELHNPHSSINTQDVLELRETKHLFLDLPLLEPLLKKWINELPPQSKVVSGIINKWLKEGLKQRCITRDLSWGVPVPKSGYENKVFYVWFDALNGYISITKDYIYDTWHQWWMPEKNCNVHYTQFMAKDNVPFHSIIWPAILLGVGQYWKKVDYIKGFNWLNYEKGKFSTSQNRGIFTDVALNLFPADYWRYYLIANIPESSDANFNFTNFANVINTDLSDKLGNFISRVLTLVNKYFDSKVPDRKNLDNKLFSQVKSLCIKIYHCYDQLKYRDLINNMRLLWSIGNEYITLQQPWMLSKYNLSKTGEILNHCLHLIRIFAIVSWPIIPISSEKIFCLVDKQNILNDIDITEAVNFNILVSGNIVSNKVNLFEKIQSKKVQELEHRFKG